MRPESTIFYDVDTQRDFLLPGGALYVSGADRIIPALAALTTMARENHIRIVCSVDRHFPDDPVMPGCLGLDALWQMIGYWLGWSGSAGKGRAVGVGEVKFRGHITPEVGRVRYEVDMRQVRRGRLVLGIADGRVLADDTCVYVAKDMRVSLIAPAA